MLERVPATPLQASCSIPLAASFQLADAPDLCMCHIYDASAPAVVPENPALPAASAIRWNSPALERSERISATGIEVSVSSDARAATARPSHHEAYDVYNRPYWSVYSMQGEEQEFGVPDRDGQGHWAEYPRGYAGMFARRLREQEYVFGWDRYADKRGRVHST